MKERGREHFTPWCRDRFSSMATYEDNHKVQVHLQIFFFSWIDYHLTAWVQK